MSFKTQEALFQSAFGDSYDPAFRKQVLRYSWGTLWPELNCHHKLGSALLSQLDLHERISGRRYFRIN